MLQSGTSGEKPGFMSEARHGVGTEAITMSERQRSVVVYSSPG
jgi:hypothetical protein